MFKLYNGCPNDELASYWGSQRKARQKLSDTAKELFGNNTRARCTYFPLEGKYSCCMWLNDDKYVELSGFHCSVESAVSEAIHNMGLLSV